MQRSFKCCRNKDFANLCCTVCLCVFHPSCAERINDVIKLGGYKIFCSTKCQSLAQKQEEKDKNFMQRIEELEKELRDKDIYIARLRRTSATLDDSVYEAERKFVSEIEKQNTHIQTLKEHINTIKKDEVGLKKEIEILNEKKIKLDQNVKEMTDMNKSLIVTIETLERNNDLLSKELREIRQKEEAKKTQEIENEDLGSKTEETAKKEDVARLVSVVSDLRQQLDDMREATKQSLQLLEQKILQKASETPSTSNVDLDAANATTGTSSKSPLVTSGIDQNNKVDDISVVSRPKVNKTSAPVTTNAVEGSDDDEDSLTWIEVKRKRASKNKNRPQHRPAPTRGSNTHQSSLKVAEFNKKRTALSWIFVSGLHPNTSEQNVLEFLKNNNLDECRCFKMRTKRDKIQSSFKLGVPEENKHSIMDSGLWPTGTIINHFLNIQSPSQMDE